MIFIETNAKLLAKAFKDLHKELEMSLTRNRQEYARIMKAGVASHFTLLGLGGSIQDANGANVKWSQARHPATIRIRKKAGLGPVFPMLSFTGKLQRLYVQGGSSTNAKKIANGRMMSYHGAPDASGLGAVHQFGGNRIPTQNNKAWGNMTVPARPFLFWDKRMSRDVMGVTKNHVKEILKRVSRSL